MQLPAQFPGGRKNVFSALVCITPLACKQIRVLVSHHQYESVRVDRIAGMKWKTMQHIAVQCTVQEREWGISEVFGRGKKDQ